MKFRVALSYTALIVALSACQKEDAQSADLVLPPEDMQGAEVSVETGGASVAAEKPGLFSRMFNREAESEPAPVVVAQPVNENVAPVEVAEVVQPVVVEPVLKQSRSRTASGQQAGTMDGLLSKISAGRLGGADMSGDAFAGCPADAALNQQMSDRVNSARDQQRKTQLKGNGKLESIAQAHACDIAATGRGSVAGSDGRNVVDRARDAGYPTCGVSQLVSAGEDSNAVLAGWMASIPHRTELLAQNGKSLGVGSARDSQGRLWWSVVIGAC